MFLADFYTEGNSFIKCCLKVTIVTIINSDKFRRNAHCSFNNEPKPAMAERTPNTIEKGMVEFGVSFPASFLLLIRYRNNADAAVPIITNGGY